MKNINKNIILAIVTILFIVIAISCKRVPCQKMPDNRDSGEIINNVIFSNASNVPIDLQQIIISDSLNSFGLLISFDRSVTCSPIDFSKYTVTGLKTKRPESKK